MPQLKTLTECVADCVYEFLVDLRGESVILQDIWPLLVRSEGPDAARSELVPVVFLFEELAYFPDGIFDVDFAAFDVLGDAVVQRFSHHGDFIFLVGCDGVAHDG